MEQRPAPKTVCDDTCSVCGLVPLLRRRKGAARVVARSAAMQAVLRRAGRFAASDAPIAILGETGTGKEVLARIVHASSPRAAKPFVAVNVAAIPAELLESELFGHGKGAFTGATTTRRGLFEAAHEGTLFLDEIGEMPLPMQAKLLRALQDGEVRRVGESTAFSVDLRVICATHRDLLARVREGSFREDLLYRLKVLTLEMPTLEERREDILPLAQHFLALERTSTARGFSTEARERLLAHAWPGNVRELENVVKHGAALATGTEVTLDDLPSELTAPRADAPARHAHAPPPPDAPPHAPPQAPARARASHASARLETLAEVERAHIERVLEACGGSQSEAARVLGIARNTLWRKLRAFA
ncbi:MAG: sigma-54 dependent transcriptional regulator [Sandaracinaceae bacterium]|nr:sigma-54 dependent transcriptional regulator [Sandaracinaceae bacterium]